MRLKPITELEAVKLAIKIGAAKYVECSAHTGEGVYDTFETAVWAVKFSSKQVCYPVH